MSRPPRPGGPLKREREDKKNCVLKGVLVCTTGLSAEKKKDVCQKLLANGGEYYDTFKSGVTHLIATAACTDKYKFAVKLGIPVVDPGWVDASIAKGELADVTEFALAPLYKVIICSSGFSAEKKIEIKELVKELGGDYTENLEEDVTRFLVAAKPEGEKYRAAREWNIPTVSLAWLEECEKKKCCVAAEPYPVKREIDAPPSRNSAPEKLRSQNCVSEQVLPTAFGPDEDIEAKWEDLDESRALEDCRIFLAGLDRCSPARQAALRGLLHKACGTLLHRVSNSVTHVVVAHKGFLTDGGVDMLLKFPTSPPIVSVRWLFDSVTDARMASTSIYPVLSSQLPKVKPESPCRPRISASQPLAVPAARSSLRRAHSIPLPPKEPADAWHRPASRDLESLTLQSPKQEEPKPEEDQDENVEPMPSHDALHLLEMGSEEETGGDSSFPPPRRLRNVFGRGITSTSSSAGANKRPIDTMGSLDDFRLTQDRAPPKRRSTLESNLRPRGKVLDTQICNEESQLIGYGDD